VAADAKVPIELTTNRSVEVEVTMPQKRVEFAGEGVDGHWAHFYFLRVALAAADTVDVEMTELAGGRELNGRL
jgi:hypothetical protein